MHFFLDHAIGKYVHDEEEAKNILKGKMHFASN